MSEIIPEDDRHGARTDEFVAALKEGGELLQATAGRVEAQIPPLAERSGDWAKQQLLAAQALQGAAEKTPSVFGVNKPKTN